MSGTIITLVPPAGTLDDLAPDPAGLHLTLLYYPELSSEDVQALARQLEAWAPMLSPVDATLNGLGRFSLEGQDALVALVDAPSLEDLRRDLRWRVPHEPSALHGFQPHITLEYLGHEQLDTLPRLTPRRVTFGDLHLWSGDQRWSWPLGTGTMRGLLDRLRAVAAQMGGRYDD